MKKKLAHYCLVLGLVCTGAAIGVSGTYLATREAIQKLEVARHNSALIKIFKGSASFVSLNPQADLIERVFKVTDPGGKILGYAATGQAQGYSSRLRVVVGVDEQLETVKGISVIYQQETPGLGARVDEIQTNKTWLRVLMGKAPPDDPEKMYPAFQKNFAGVKLSQLRVKKAGQPGEGIDAITGATITSKAVVAAVRDAVRKIQAQLGEKRE